MSYKEQRWTYPKIVERAKTDAIMDHMFRSKDQYNDAVKLFKKNTDIRDYEYNYNKFYAKEEASEKPDRSGLVRKRGSRG